MWTGVKSSGCGAGGIPERHWGAQTSKLQDKITNRQYWGGPNNKMMICCPGGLSGGRMSGDGQV